MSVLAFAAALLVAACGKTSGSSRVAGLWHLPSSPDATSLALYDDGTFSLRRESCTSAGVVTCGDWRVEAAGAKVIAPASLYWPTPDRFPSAVVQSLSLQAEGRELVVVGANAWAGSFEERWAPGRSCAVCTTRVTKTGETVVEASARSCSDRLPPCARL